MFPKNHLFFSLHHLKIMCWSRHRWTGKLMSTGGGNAWVRVNTSTLRRSKLPTVMLMRWILVLMLQSFLKLISSCDNGPFPFRTLLGLIVNGEIKVAVWHSLPKECPLPEGRSCLFLKSHDEVMGSPAVSADNGGIHSTHREAPLHQPPFQDCVA